jgi:hypothetical protein
MASEPEPWLRGPIEGVEPLLLPAAHALIQAREEVATLVVTVPAAHVWQRPGGAASIGFHVRHIGGALDRLFTYARGEGLTDAQKAFARGEGAPGEPAQPLAEAAAGMDQTIDQAFAQLRATSRDDLLTERGVGRLQLPTTVLGLLFHAAEHSVRHADQAVSTAKILAG